MKTILQNFHKIYTILMISVILNLKWINGGSTTEIPEFSEDVNGNFTYDEHFEAEFYGNLIQCVIYFHILPIISTCMIGLTVHNFFKRRTQMKMDDHCYRVHSNGVCDYCESIEFNEKRHLNKYYNGQKKGFSFKLKSKISAPSAPKQYGWVDEIEKENDGKGSENLNKDGKVIEKLKKKKERTQTALSIDTTAEETETIDDREDDSKAVSRGTIHFKTQFITDGDIMIEETDEKPVKLKKVTFDENPIEFYEIGLEVEEFEAPTISSKGTGSSTIMTASIKQIVHK
ncbi:hypothetical protein L5515_005571 [Caenorhabditis briggsae]|uniref:Uncharacterized protein n=2 Tax=Caenorhabditis briggsae TaxID=6238 RepID=A0AAE9EKN7_CAEBR|nr:hypothetical protein L5515_005571 [Caenorhabditis briggsae]